MREVKVCSFSGGRSSALMALMVKDEVDCICFQNTGMESPETYEFVKAFDERMLDGKLVMLEYHRAEDGTEGYRRVPSHDELTKGGGHIP